MMSLDDARALEFHDQHFGLIRMQRDNFLVAWDNIFPNEKKIIDSFCLQPKQRRRPEIWSLRNKHKRSKEWWKKDFCFFFSKIILNGPKRIYECLFSSCRQKSVSSELQHIVCNTIKKIYSLFCLSSGFSLFFLENKIFSFCFMFQSSHTSRSSESIRIWMKKRKKKLGISNGVNIMWTFQHHLPGKLEKLFQKEKENKINMTNYEQCFWTGSR